MRPVHTFTVVRPLPERLRALHDVAYNLWWSWHEDGRRLFERMHPDLWQLTRHNPLLVLDRMDPSRLESLEQDEAFLEHLDRVQAALDAYMG